MIRARIGAAMLCVILGVIVAFLGRFDIAAYLVASAIFCVQQLPREEDADES